MAEYLDSSGGAPEQALGHWLAAALVPGVRALRLQTGFFSIGSLRDHLETLRDVEVVRLVLGSNAPEQPTVEDIRALLPLLTDPASRSLTIVSCAGPALFHPKTIHLVAPDGTARGYAGSANMTEAGLGLNIEAGVVLGPESADALAAMAAAIDSWAARNDEGVFHVRNGDDLDALLDQGVLQTAAHRRASRTASRAAGEARRRVPGLRRDRLWRPATRIAADGTGEEAAEAVAEGTPGPTRGRVEHLRWCKRLKRSDAQQVPAGTNPTGKLRLAQARFPIDQQRYFREEFFGDATWAEVERRGTLYEECSVPFSVSIHGVDLGEQVLRVDHASHRVADQNNVPTVLGWGPVLGRHLREHSEVDNWVVIERHEDGTYSLAITDQRPGWAP
ncbi:phospholipase D family protein [Engelhardtia mirabilis]|uniref:Phospholipase D-like domain-containing protein n=1 Tax=Engelhardtia mirabilis TaxID=2528011 RepID=A0A518BK43_9BACT|nr:hypothetical protein Pla133_23940 [Planctomycetes bacterium Pla133]QDV01639.1 hypothetical protein Pla86_23930 [Planctomycetes bacterium Pla86]